MEETGLKVLMQPASGGPATDNLFYISSEEEREIEYYEPTQKKFKVSHSDYEEEEGEIVTEDIVLIDHTIVNLATVREAISVSILPLNATTEGAFLLMRNKTILPIYSGTRGNCEQFVKKLYEKLSL